MLFVFSNGRLLGGVGAGVSICIGLPVAEGRSSVPRGNSESKSTSLCRFGSLCSATSVVKVGFSRDRPLLSIRRGDIPGPRYRIRRLAGESAATLPVSDLPPGEPGVKSGPPLARTDSTRRLGVEGAALEDWIPFGADLTGRGLSVRPADHPPAFTAPPAVPRCSASIFSIRVLITRISSEVIV